MKHATSILLTSFLLFLSGCSNYPYPKVELKANGTPKTIWYQTLQEDPRSLDPQVTYDSVSQEVLFNIDESLYQYHYLKRKPFVLIPALGDGMPVRTRDADGGETYTLKIKKNILFQNDPCFVGGRGREVTSDDFIYAIKRIADPFIKAPTSPPVYETFAELIMGFTDFYKIAQQAGKANYSKPVLGLEKVDRYTFKIHLKKVYPQLKYWLAMPFFSPVPIEAITYYDGQLHDGERHEQFMFHPVGAGAYRLKSWERNQRLILVRNENYNRRDHYPTDGDQIYRKQGLLKDAGKPLPFVDEAYFTITREAIPMWTLFRQGYIDAIGHMGKRLGTENMAMAVASDGNLSPEFEKAGVRLDKITKLSTDYIAFNMRDPIVGKNKKLRQAMSTVYNFDRFNDYFFFGTKVKAQTPVPPGIFSYDPNYQNPFRTQDLVKAKQLMKEAGYEDGIDPKTGKPLALDFLYIAKGAESQREGQYITDQFRKIGINLNVKLITWSEMQTSVKQGRYQISRYGWVGDYPDPENFFFVFYSKSSGDTNITRYANPEFDKLFVQMQSMEDTPERLAVINKMRDILNEDCPWLYTFHEAFYAMNQGWTEHVLLHPVSYDMLKYYKVDPILRAKKQAEWNQPNYIFLIAFAGLLSVAIVPLVLLRRKS